MFSLSGNWSASFPVIIARMSYTLRMANNCELVVLVQSCIDARIQLIVPEDSLG